MSGAMWGAVAIGLLTPVAMIGCFPVYMYQSRRPPNRWSGYRTERAMSSERNWRGAQVMCARIWVQIGVVSSIVTLIGFGVLYGSGNRVDATWWWVALVFALLPLGGMLWSVLVIEKRLEQLDDSEATRS